MQPGQILIFLHIPKTAGTTLKAILDREYGKKRTLVIEGDYSKKRIPEIAYMPLEARRQIQLVRGGHIVFGIHRFIPSASTYITILREPVNRVVSHYYHILRTKWHPLHQVVAARRLSLQDYVTSGVALEMDNGQTRQLSGVQGVPFGQCTESLLTEALDNMNRYFSCVGLTEFFDESLIRMRHILGWRKLPVYVEKLRNTNKPPLMTIPDKTLAIIRERNDLDCRLYEHAKSALKSFGSPGEIEEIKRFRRINMFYRALGKVLAFQNSIHRPLVKKMERFLKS